MPHQRPHLVVTLGPATLPHLRHLRSAGATAFRLNASHLEVESLNRWLVDIRAVAPDLPVVIDLQGAKMRLGDFSARLVQTGEMVRFALAPQGDELPLPHPELITEVAPGEVLSCDDDRLRFEVEQSSEGQLIAKSLATGTIKARAGINRYRQPVEARGLSLRDGEFVRAACQFPPVSFAYSFMIDGREAAWLRGEAPECPVIGKVECSEAIAAIGSVLRSVDEVWICRGDLGAQVGPAQLARFVSTWRPPRDASPVLMAGQVLHSLVNAPDASRSELCHLYDLLRRGYRGIVLSNETAIGSTPLKAVRVARRLLDDLSSA